MSDMQYRGTDLQCAERTENAETENRSEAYARSLEAGQEGASRNEERARIVFFCIPAYGHVNPTLGVVRELADRGHRVRYYCYDRFREEIEAAGAEYVSCDDCDLERDLDPRDAARMGRDLAFSTKILVDTTLALDDRISRELEHFCPDCIVADSMAVWGKAAALKRRIPFVSSTTTFAFNRYSARIMKRSPGELLRMMLSMPRINRDIGRLRSSGYPVRNVLDLIQNDEKTDTIVYTSPQFQPCADTFSEKYAFVGPLVRASTGTVGKRREKLIYISMGTVNNDMPGFYQNCIKALKGTDYQVIMSVGNLWTRKGLEICRRISLYFQMWIRLRCSPGRMYFCPTAA